MAKRIIKRVVPLIGVIALLLNLAVVPQRARAVAVTATVVAASAAAILTACGVSYWAATQTDAIDYISGKLEDYLSSIEVDETPADWLGVSATAQPFTVIAGGALRFTSAVANKLLGFARWFQDTEGLESGGDAVSNAVSVPISTYLSSGAGDGSYINVTALSDSIVSVDYLLWRTGLSSECIGYFYIPIETSSTTIVVTCKKDMNTGSFGARFKTTVDNSYFGTDTSMRNGATVTVNKGGTVGYLYIAVKVNPSPGISNKIEDTVLFEISNTDDLLTPATATVTPSEFVNVPADIAEDATFDLTTSADISSTDDTDTASEAIIDGITAEDGLTSEVQESPGTSWGWLYTLLSNIAGTIGAGVSDIKDKLDGIKGSADDAAEAAQGASTAAQGAATAAQDAATAAQGVETAVEGLQSTAEGIEDNTATIARNLAPATYGDVADYQLDLTSLFPFCIPRDIYTAIGLLVAEPEAPSIDWDMPLPNGSTYHIEYDLSDWDGIASLLRHLELLLYGVGLMMATKSIIKW